MPHSPLALPDPRDLVPVDFPYERLNRWPDPAAENLFAFDATDRLLIDMAAPAIRGAASGSVVVIGDRYGALTLAAASLGAREISCHQDAFGGRMALEANSEVLVDVIGRAAESEDPQDAFVSCELGGSMFAGAEVVLMQLPKDLTQLEYWASLIAAYASPSVQVFAGGRIKHMTRAMNEVLGRHFGRVSASLARQKSRVLVAGESRRDTGLADIKPSEYFDPELELWVCSFPGAFASGRVDHGTRFLVPFIEEMPRFNKDRSSGDIDGVRRGGREFLPESGGTAADLGCGTGLLAAALLRSHPEYHVIATDRSAAAVHSAKATLRRNGYETSYGAGYEVRQDHALFHQPDASLDLIVCNPPFHSEASISTALSEFLFNEVARTLRPGGVMLTVFNSHLQHRRTLERVVGPTEQLGRNQKFTVTRSLRVDRSHLR